MTPESADDPVDRTVEIDLGPVRLVGDLVIPAGSTGIVVFAHGSGSSRYSPRNRSVALALNDGGLATLLIDLLTVEEELDRANVFDIELLANRLVGTTRWLRRQPEAHNLGVGFFGASTGALRPWWLPLSSGGRYERSSPVVAGPTSLRPGSPK